MHSFPKTPADPFPKNRPVHMFPAGSYGGRTLMSQHMFCATLTRNHCTAILLNINYFTEEQMLDFLVSIEAAYPPIVFWNFDFTRLEKKVSDSSFVKTVQKITQQEDAYQLSLVTQAKVNYLLIIYSWLTSDYRHATLLMQIR